MTNHSFTCPLIRIIIASSDRNNPDRSIPTGFLSTKQAIVRIRFNRINQDRSIPTCEYPYVIMEGTQEFQSYQSKQINPDIFEKYVEVLDPTTFQSYQSKQINPDAVS